jgi:two-component system, cell cycle sensor histidine kinase and response regulator CckA
MASPEELALQNENQRLRTIIAGLEERFGVRGAERQTNRRQLEERWQRQEAFWTLAENSTDAIDRLDLEGRHLYVNAAFAKMVSLSPETIIGRTNRELGVPDPLARIWKEHFHSIFESGETIEIEDSFPAAGDARFFEIRCIPEIGPDGAVTSVVAVYRDITDSKRLDEALRESEERLQLTQNVASIGWFDLNLQTGLSTWTPELLAMYGLPPGGFPPTYAEWGNLIHPDERTEARQRVEESCKSGTPGDAEWRVIRPDGTMRWLAGRWRVFRDAAGEPSRMMGVSIDVTDRKTMEEALRQSEERFRLAINASDAVYDVDLATATVSWNETYLTLYGKPPESDSWQWWIDSIHPEDRERAVAGLRGAISSSASSWSCEYRFQRADGAWAFIFNRAYIALDAAGRARRVIGAMQDLTDHKRAEAELRESYQQYKEVFDNISVCVFLLDVTPDGRFKVAAFNPAEEQVVGLSNAEVSGRFIEDILGEELASHVIANYRRCLYAGRTIKFDDDLNLPQGRRYFHTNLIPLRNADGVINRIIGACIDITDLKRTQEEALAKQNLESLGVLAGGIAHDFNNLLGGIHAQAELIETDLAVGSTPREEIQKIKAAAIRGSEIVRELMVYAGQNQPHFVEAVEAVEAVDVSLLVKEMLELLKVLISKHAVLRTNLADDLPAVSGNAPQLRQVVMNLVINASEAIGEKDGVITATTALVSSGRDPGLEATDLPWGDYVRLEVSDTGSGITDEAKAKIFDPFFSTKFAGRGMGLAVVQAIVRDHRGAINVASTPGHGTTFQVWLPCAAKKASENHNAIPSTGSEISSSRTGTILVVEDEDLLRAAVSKALRKIGFSVIEASDGSYAVELMRAHKDEIDAVLLDVTIPGTSSREVFEQVRKMRPDLRVVVTSAHSKETIDASFTGLRVERFIRKPFRIGEMVRSLTDPVSS